MLKSVLAASAALIAFTTPASAQQFTAASDICDAAGFCDNASYIGPLNGNAGIVVDGGYDAFDGYGFVRNPDGNPYSGLFTVSRQTELLTGTNTYRFFDTFTNNTGSTINETIRFYGNLGSDGNENIVFSNSGAIVTCDSPTCTGYDPALALVFQNNGFGSGAVSFNAFDAYYNLSLGAGESVSLLSFAYLVRDMSNRSGDLALAVAGAQDLYNNPNVSGLTQAQQNRIVNFDLGGPGGVPEPATWAMLVLGFGVLGSGMRRRTARGVANASSSISASLSGTGWRTAPTPSATLR